MSTKPFVPAWAKNVVWYQIFPERFANGDPTNDPRLEDQATAWPHDQVAPYRIHPWSADWYQRQPYEENNHLDIYQTLHRRRYGGDLQGIFDKLDYLQALGIGAIYLNPVFTAASEHKYDGATYHHIDPTFGPDPDGDRALIAQETPHDPQTWVWTSADKLMLKLIRELHARDIRIIFDGVFNHMGVRSWAFQDLLQNGANSPVADWFKISSWEPFAYQGWAGVPELPELSQDEQGLTQGPRDYIFACTRRWMDPNDNGNPYDGIDGWRLDVAFCIAHPFWKAWRNHVKELNPEAYLTAEIIRPIPETIPYLQGDEFDAVMNYNFAWSVAEWLWQEQERITTAEFDRQLHELITAYPEGVADVMQNLYDSHDSARLATHIVNRDWLTYRDWGHYHGEARAVSGKVDLRKPNEQERQIQKVAVILQMCYVGAPMIYYGDEAGMWGANDPCCRQPMLWPELGYAPAQALPNGSPRPSAEEVAFDQDLFDHYRRLIGIRNNSRALQEGPLQTLSIGENLYAFKRECDGEEVVVIVNRGNSAETLTLPLQGSWLNLLEDGILKADAEGLAVVVRPMWATLLKKSEMTGA